MQQRVYEVSSNSVGTLRFRALIPIQVKDAPAGPQLLSVHVLPQISTCALDGHIRRI